MTGIVFNLPPKNKPKNQRAADPDVVTQQGAVHGVSKPWTRHVVEDKHNAGDNRSLGEKATKPQTTDFQKRQKFQQGQQQSGKGAQGGGVQAVGEDVPLVQKLGMSLQDIVAKRKAGKPTAEWEMGTHLGQRQRAKTAKAAAEQTLASDSQPQQADHPQQQQQFQKLHMNPQQFVQKNQKQTQHQLQQQHQQMLLPQQQVPQQQQPHIQNQVFKNNNRNRNNPQHLMYQPGQSLNAYTAVSPGAAKAQKQAQHYNGLTTNGLSHPSNLYDTETDLDQLGFEDGEEVALFQPKPRKARLAYTPHHAQAQQQTYQQQQQQNYQQQQQNYQQQEAVFLPPGPLDQQRYMLQGGEDMMQDDAFAEAVHQQAVAWMDQSGQEHFETQVFECLDAGQQQPYQTAGYLSKKKQRKLAALAGGGLWPASSQQQQQQHGPLVMFLQEQDGYPDTNMVEQQQGYTQHQEQYDEDGQFDQEEGVQQQQQQHRKQQARRQQQQQQQQIRSHSHVNRNMLGNSLHGTPQIFEEPHHMPSLHGPPASSDGLAWPDPRQPNYTSRHHNSTAQYMDSDGIPDASVGGNGAADGAETPGNALYDSHNQGQTSRLPNSTSQHNYVRDARDLLNARKGGGVEQESLQQQPERLSMPDIMRSSEQQPRGRTQDQPADNSPGTSRSQRHAATVRQAPERVEQYQQHAEYRPHAYADPGHGQMQERSIYSGDTRNDRYTHQHQLEHREAPARTGGQGTSRREQDNRNSQLQPSAAAELQPPSRHQQLEDDRAPIQHQERSREQQRGDLLPHTQRERHHQSQRERQSLTPDLEPAGPSQHHQRISRDRSPEADDTWDPRSSRPEHSQLYELTQAAEPQNAYVQPTRDTRTSQRLPRSPVFNDDRNGDDIRGPYVPPPDAYSPQRVAHSFEPEEGEFDGRMSSPVSDWQQQTQQGLKQQTDLAEDEPRIRQQSDRRASSPRVVQQPSRKRDAEQREYAGDEQRNATNQRPSHRLHTDQDTSRNGNSMYASGDERLDVMHNQQQQRQHPRFKTVSQSGADQKWVAFTKREGQPRLPPEESYRQAGRSAQQNQRERSRDALMQDRAEASARPNTGTDSRVRTSDSPQRDGQRSPVAAVTRPAAAANNETRTHYASTGHHTDETRASAELPTKTHPNRTQASLPGASLRQAPPLSNDKPQPVSRLQAPRSHSPQPMTGRTTTTSTTSNHHPTAGAATSRQALPRAPLSLANIKTSSPIPLSGAAARSANTTNGAQRRIASPVPEIISIDEDEGSPEPSPATIVHAAKKAPGMAGAFATPSVSKPTHAPQMQGSATAKPASLNSTLPSAQHNVRAAATQQRTAPAALETAQLAHSLQPAVGTQKTMFDMAGHAAATTAKGMTVPSAPAVPDTGLSLFNRNEATHSSVAVAERDASLNNSSAAAGQTASIRVSTRTPIPAPQFSSRAAALQAAAANGIPGLSPIPSTTNVVTATVLVPAAIRQAPAAATPASISQTAVLPAVPGSLSGAMTGTADASHAMAGAASTQGAAAAHAPNVSGVETAAAPAAGVSSHASWRQQRKQRMLQQPPQQPADESAAAPHADEDEPPAVIMKVPIIKQEPKRR